MGETGSARQSFGIYLCLHRPTPDLYHSDNMSVTTSAQTISLPVVRRVLQDYDIQHGVSQSPSNSQNSRPDLETAGRTSNPPNWPTRYRDIPPHKPINRDLDREQRPGGLGVIEQLFIATLLNGCRVNAVSDTVHKG